MNVRYMVALDFECTAMPTQRQMSTGNWFREITEIGAVLFDVTRNGSVAEFRSYVRPTRFPQLSDRYQRTFGISQVVIEPQRRLKEVLEEFSEWVDDIEFRYDIELIPAPCWYEYPGGAYMCTWSSNDLRHILRKELAEKYLEYPEYFKCWFDIQKVVKEHYPRLPSYKLFPAAQSLGVATVGNAHSALNDAHVLARVAQKLWQNNIRKYALDSI